MQSGFAEKILSEINDSLSVGILNQFAIKLLLIDAVHLHNDFQLKTNCLPRKIYIAMSTSWTGKVITV